MDKTGDKRDLSRLKIEHRDEDEGAAGMPFVRVLLPLAVVAMLSAGIIWWLLRGRQISEQDSKPVSAKQEVHPRAKPQTGGLLNATGYVVAQRRAAVSSKATGRLKELSVKEGDTVAANQVIGILENDDLVQLVERQKAALQAAKAQVAAAQAELRVAELGRERSRRLIGQQAVSQEATDAAEARFLRAQAGVAAEYANVAVAEAGLREAQVNLDYTLIRAPFDGTVLTKNADIGEVVAPFGSSTDARAAVVTIADMSSLEVEADVSEANLAKVRVGQECAITLDSFPDKVYRGLVDSIEPTVDRAKATVLVKIKFIDKDKSVIPEMSAKVEFQLQG